MAFTPYLFIGIGSTSAYFTLREAYLHEFQVHLDGAQSRLESEVRSAHLFNLSQDASEAFRKAEEFAEEMGMELRTTLDQIQIQMREIKRATAEQIVERARIEKQREDEWAAARAADLAEKLSLVKDGKFPIGPYRGLTFEEADRGYLDWLMRTLPDFEEESLMRAIAEAVNATCSHLRFPIPDPVMVVGAAKKRMLFDVTVTRCSYFDRPSWNGYGYERVFVTTMVTSEGACLVCFSPSFYPDLGDELKIKATVKEHSEYEGQAQTVVQRVAIQ